MHVSSGKIVAQMEEFDADITKLKTKSVNILMKLSAAINKP